MCKKQNHRIFSVTELYYYFKPPLGCSNNNLINGGWNPSSGLGPGKEFLKCQNEKQETPDLCITGPHKDSKMFFVHSGVGFQAFDFSPNRPGPSNHADWLAWELKTSVASCNVAEISVRRSFCLDIFETSPQNFFEMQILPHPKFLPSEMLIKIVSRLHSTKFCPGWSGGRHS